MYETTYDLLVSDFRMYAFPVQHLIYINASVIQVHGRAR